MKVECPACSRQFNIDPGRIKKDRLKVRCSGCAKVFLIQKNRPAPRPGPEVESGPADRPPSSPQAGESVVRVKCLQCGAELAVEERMIPDKGARAECPKCRERFVLRKVPQ